MNKKYNLDRSKRVIVTGATGTIGSEIIPKLLVKGYKVCAVSRDAQKAKKFSWFDKVKFYSFNLKDDFHNDFKKYDGLIHLAWDHLEDYDTFRHFDQNLKFSFNFLKNAIDNGISNILVAGTCYEYGNQFGPLRSDTLTNPINNYAIAKDTLRKLLLNYSKVEEKKLNLQWARLFFLLKSGTQEKGLFASLNKAIEEKKPEFKLTSGEQLLDFIDISEACNQILELFESRKTGEYNICRGVPISVRKLVEQYVNEKCSDINLKFGALANRSYEPMAFWGVRDIAETIYLPSLPNAPSTMPEEKQNLGPMKIRFNESLKFLENAAFDCKLIDYEIDYENSQAYSGTFKTHMQKVLDRIKGELPRGSKIVEVGCGKGDFVELVQSDGYFLIEGYDASYEGNNSLIKKRYLNHDDRLSADIVVLRHVLEHIPRPHEFLTMLSNIFGHTKILIEVPNYDWIEENQAFFDITYEHVNYFTPLALKSLFKFENLSHELIFKGQYQLLLSNFQYLSDYFQNKYENGDWVFKSFSELFPEIEKKIKYFDSLATDQKVFVWGAATKGCLFLTHSARIGNFIDKINYCIDVNPHKIGKFIPNLSIAIKSKADFFKDAKPGDLLIIANPAYENEILREIEIEKLTDLKIEVL